MMPAAVLRTPKYEDMKWLARAAVFLFGAAVLAVLAVLTNGNVAIPSGLVCVLTGVFVIAVRPAVGFAFLIFMTLLCEQFGIGGLKTPITLMIPMFLNLNLLGVPGGVVNLVELWMALLALSWIMRIIATRRFDFQPVPNLWAVLAFMGTLIFFMGYGLAQHGDFKTALWEVRALFYLCLAYLLGTQLIRTRAEMILVTWAIVISVAIKGLQGIYRYLIELGGDLGEIPAITGHEDAVFMVIVFILTIALVFFRSSQWRLIRFGIMTFPTTFLTFVLTQRRIAYGALAFGMIILFAFMPRAQKWLFVRLSLPMIPVALLYAAVFWNSSGTLAMPIQQVKSIFESDDDGADRSNLYREIENFNLQETIKAYPQGIGFGKKYLIIIPLDEIDFPLWEYIPHNCILWPWVKMGFLGFWVFWIFFGMFIVQIAWDFRFTCDAFYRSIQVLAVIFIVCQCIVSKYDLQLTFYRNMIFLGAVLALTVTARQLGGAAEEERKRKVLLLCR